jgi:hypothetical protein
MGNSLLDEKWDADDRHDERETPYWHVADNKIINFSTISIIYFWPEKLISFFVNDKWLGIPQMGYLRRLRKDGNRDSWRIIIRDLRMNFKTEEREEGKKRWRDDKSKDSSESLM